LINNSTIPSLPDLEKFFSGLEKRLKNLDRQNDYAEYIKTVKANAKEIRDKILKGGGRLPPPTLHLV